jgi:ABC-type transport system involved in Fe-S cluster assembly fused permease/ATPase subunit
MTMVPSEPNWQFVLMTVFSLLAAHLVATAILSWSVSTRRQRSPLRRSVKRRAMQRLARTSMSAS